ncbi:S-adenosylhomocysteine deaminase, methylthioadenosine deaminase [Clostridiaceae bacterium JG1575]|nr:S-adenosylhomocysteine deaminase, methylthioadenosine deaminase [Clostridiaceae bacterium JG1575]
MIFEQAMVYTGEILLDDQVVVVREGRIESIGPDKVLPQPGESVRSAKGHLMMPGLANTHCHIPMTLLRGYGEGLPLQRWLFEKMFPFEEHLTPQDIYWGTSLGLLELIASGCTFYEDMYYEVEEIARATAQAGLRANIGRGVTQTQSGRSFFEHVAYQDTERLAERIKKEGWSDLLRVDVTLHAEYTTEECLMREVAAYAKETERILQVHVSETRAEQEACLQKYGVTPLGLLERSGVLDGPVVAAHCVHVSKGDLTLLKEHKVSVAHCISSNLKLGSGIAPIKAMKEAGIAVTLGTDGAASNNNLNMFEELHLAAMVHKGVNEDSLLFSPQEMLHMASRAGFEAGHRWDCGFLKAGAAADLLLLDLSRAHLQPGFDRLSDVVYSAQASDVALTMVAGQILYEKGEYKTLDEEKIKFEAKRSQRRILQELGVLR